LHSFVVINPNTIAQAKAADLPRKTGKTREPMAGIPLLVDNVATRDSPADDRWFAGAEG